VTSRLFGVGIAGKTLVPEERMILESHPPRAVILFQRNIESVGQVRALIAEIRRLPGPPLLCVDQEGGPVDRLRDAIAPSISFREAAQMGVAREAGELAGEACARLGFDVDLAPVVDRLMPGASERVLRDRCASADPEEVSRAALEFLAGLHANGIGGCVKHFPGLGRADLDTHEELPRIPSDRAEEERDLAPFRATMEQAGAVMISHAAGPDGVPASLSRATAHGLLRERLGFSRAAFSDDLEMGALASFGGLPDRCALAALAGCDLLFVCSRIAEYPSCVESVTRALPENRRAEAEARLTAYTRSLRVLREAARPPAENLQTLAERIRALRERLSPG
jgi:beta-N-acetylhexosaminidase